MNALQLLRLILTVAGCWLMVATFAVIMPTTWMAAIHDSLGIGPFPESPLTQYLTRSAAALYAVHGGVMLVASRDPLRLSSLVRYLGISNMVLGPVLLAIDLHAGMPLAWTLIEGPAVAMGGFLYLWLLLRAERQAGSNNATGLRSGRDRGDFERPPGDREHHPSAGRPV